MSTKFLIYYMNFDLIEQEVEYSFFFTKKNMDACSVKLQDICMVITDRR